METYSEHQKTKTNDSYKETVSHGKYFHFQR